MHETAPIPSLFARALRGGALTARSYAVAQGARLVSNLILARLLLPEAFGIMALVTVFLVGLVMFSDVGIAPCISQNARGDDPDFLNSAWTINVARGVILWLAACALAVPLSQFHAAPDLAQLLPVAGPTLLIAGFNPSRTDTANRHLLLGRATALDLVAQIVGIAAMVGLAFAMQSVWALVLGAIAGALIKLALLGVPLVHLLYDDRCLRAGAVVVAVACVQMVVVWGWLGLVWGGGAGRTNGGSGAGAFVDCGLGATPWGVGQAP